MPFKHPSWSDLIGAVVEIRLRGEPVDTGEVEEATADSSILWISANGVRPRTLYDAASGYEVWVEPRELDGNARFRMTASSLLGAQKPSASLPASSSREPLC